MAKTAERNAYDALLKEHYPPGRTRGKPVSDKVKEEIAAALAKAKDSEKTKTRLNPRSSAGSATARNAKVVSKSAPLSKNKTKLPTVEEDEALLKKIEKERVKNAKLIASGKKTAEAIVGAKPLKELPKPITVGTAQFQQKEKETDAPRMIRIDNTDNGPKVNPKSTAPVKHIQELRKVMDDKGGKFGEKAGRKAIQNFFETTFGYTPTVTYDDPAKFGDQIDSYGKKKGGKVTAKRPTAKKYAMNRGGKVASVRKPTRA